MYEYILKHEAFMRKALDGDKYERSWLLEYHHRQILYVQHERLIHLIITLFFALIFLGSVICTFCYDSLLLPLLDLILLILVAFYIRHYYRLENCLERWYKLYTKLKLEEVDESINFKANFPY